MFSSKRKRDDSDDDEPSFGRQILPVARLPDDFDGVPTDGLQYLFTVRRDARYLPHVTRAANPYETSELKIEPGPSYDGRQPSLPSEEWCSLFLKRFKNFRKNSTQPTITVRHPAKSTSGRLMPDKRERDNWWAFICGRPQVDWDPPKKPKKIKPDKRNRYDRGMRGWSDEYEVEMTYDEEPMQETYRIKDEGEVELVVTIDPAESLLTPSSTPAPQTQFDEQQIHGVAASTKSGQGSSSDLATKRIFPRQPTPSLLNMMDNRYCLHLLMYFGHWIDLHLQQPFPRSSYLTDTHASWIFTLLSRVDEFLTGDEISQLRTLARSCLSLIKDLKQHASNVTQTPLAKSHKVEKDLESPIAERACWVIVTTIVGFWRQYDLWIDAEAILSSV